MSLQWSPVTVQLLYLSKQYIFVPGHKGTFLSLEVQKCFFTGTNKQVQTCTNFKGTVLVPLERQSICSLLGTILYFDFLVCRWEIYSHWKTEVLRINPVLSEYSSTVEPVDGSVDCKNKVCFRYLGNLFLLCIPKQCLQYFTICTEELKDYQDKVFGSIFCHEHGPRK